MAESKVKAYVRKAAPFVRVHGVRGGGVQVSSAHRYGRRGLPFGRRRVRRRLEDWATLHNDRHGFLIAYPIEVFEQKADPATDEGRVLYSRDGKAQLLVGAFENDD